MTADVDADLRAYFEQPAIAHLATVLPDGAPHVVPIWVGLDGARLTILTGPRSRKARNVARDPRVSLSMTPPGRPNAMAHLRGRVVATIEGDAVWPIADRLAERYLGGPYPLREDRVVLLVEVDHVWAHDYEAPTDP